MNAEDINIAGLASFSHTLSGLQTGLKRDYDRGVNRDLSQQQYQQVFRRNVINVLNETYQQVLAELQQLSFANESQGDALCVKLMQSFDGVIEELILYALQKHRSSCALSNFPEEHNPSQDYIAEVIDEACRDWSAFSMQVNKMVAS